MVPICCFKPTIKISIVIARCECSQLFRNRISFIIVHLNRIWDCWMMIGWSHRWISTWFHCSHTEPVRTRLIQSRMVLCTRSRIDRTLSRFWFGFPWLRTWFSNLSLDFQHDSTFKIISQWWNRRIWIQVKISKKFQKFFKIFVRKFSNVPSDLFESLLLTVTFPIPFCWPITSSDSELVFLPRLKLHLTVVHRGLKIQFNS